MSPTKSNTKNPLNTRRLFNFSLKREQVIYFLEFFIRNLIFGDGEIFSELFSAPSVRCSIQSNDNEKNVSQRPKNSFHRSFDFKFALENNFVSRKPLIYFRVLKSEASVVIAG